MPALRISLRGGKNSATSLIEETTGHRLGRKPAKRSPMARRLFLFLLLMQLSSACASGARNPAPAPNSNSPKLPRSSIAAVLEQRDELHLNEEQVRRLR